MSSDGPVTADRIAAVLREVNQALVGADSRREPEQGVCEILADADPYVYAWIGEHDADADRVVPRATAEDDADYLEEITITVDSGPTSRGPTARAIRTGELQVQHDIESDPDYESWRAAGRERGFAASAAVPLGDDGSEHGVLNVYADRAGAFDDDERTLLAELGRTVGNAVENIDLRDRLEARSAAYERLTERISDAFYAVDADWTITYWNDRMADRTGVDAEAVVGERFEDVFPSVWDGEPGEHYRRAMETGEPLSFETYLEDPYDYWVEVDVYPDEDGLSVISRDVTERKERERQLAAVVENTRNPIYIKDLDGRYRLMNDAAASLFGIDRTDAVGRTDEELFDAESAAAVRAVDREIVETGRPDTRETVRYIDGEKHVFLDNKFPYRDATGEVTGVMGVSVDVTERVEKERELAETTRTLEAVIEASPDAIVMTDEAFRVTRWNDGAADLFGWSEEEVLGEPIPFVPDEKRGEFRELIDRLDEDGRNTAVETVRQTKAGELVEVSVSSARVEADGDVVGYMATFRDVSRRKEYERRLEAQNRKLEVLNRIVRHDIRNDMQAVGSYAELIAERTEDSELADFGREVVDGVDHAVELTEAMRDIVETVLSDGETTKPVALGPVLRDEIEDLRSAYPHATVTTATTLPEVKVRADEMLGSVFRNVLKNAVQHNPAEEPSVTVSVETSQDAVTVSVADDGPGISDELKQAVFEKGVMAGSGAGTGVGLFLVSALVESYGGAVRAEDGDSGGTVVRIELPTASE